MNWNKTDSDIQFFYKLLIKTKKKKNRFFLISSYILSSCTSIGNAFK